MRISQGDAEFVRSGHEIGRSEGAAPIAPIDLLRPRQGYQHEAFFWRTPDDFLASSIPFIRDGLNADESVMVALIADRNALVQAALGHDAERVIFVDMAEMGRNPANILAGWQRFLDAHSAGDKTVRGIGEPIWAGRRREEIVECQLHEALLNVAVDPELPFRLLCPYNSDQLDHEVIDEAHRSHPTIGDADTHREGPLYGGRNHLEVFLASSLPDLQGTSDQLHFNRTTLQRILPFVAARALTAGVSADQVRISRSAPTTSLPAACSALPRVEWSGSGSSPTPSSARSGTRPG